MRAFDREGRGVCYGSGVALTRRTLVVGVSVVALLATLPMEPASAVRFLPGIDVSHWDGSINWKAVARSGIRFAIAKATDGQTFNDPTYLTNKKGAARWGIRFTGYHRATPSRSTSDAVAEADHFVNFARLRSGNLLPALDLELWMVDSRLSASDLIEWTWAWLRRVRARLGVKAMIYTSPSGWRERMGDTTVFAKNGYKVLWIAHWDTDTPSVPAYNWGGHGWTFWQWTDCGKVPGIEGCVDRDRYNGTDLSRVTIP